MKKLNLKNLTRNFDIKSYLDSIGIYYDEEGDNVTKDSININCCFCSDHANHLGINIKNKLFNCWLCRTSTKEAGGIIGLLKELEGINRSTAIKRLKEYRQDDFSDLFEDDEIKESKLIRNKNSKVLPIEFKKIIKDEESKIIKKYFKKRKFPLSYIQKYNVGWCKSGKYAYHLILPIIIENKIVSFLAADMAGYASAKYRICPDALALMPRKQILYGLDDIMGAKQIFIVEGYTDRWRIGKKLAVSLLYSTWSSETLIQIKKRVAEDCIVKVLLDLDAFRKGQELADNIQTLFPYNTYFIGLEKKDGAIDPDELSKKQIKKLINLK